MAQPTTTAPRTSKPAWNHSTKLAVYEERVGDGQVHSAGSYPRSEDEEGEADDGHEGEISGHEPDEQNHPGHEQRQHGVAGEFPAHDEQEPEQTCHEHGPGDGWEDSSGRHRTTVPL